ncbi:MAG: efflux RND transporter periplasmic adaptor subunit [Bacteroidales bacterium]|jgi:HlyD family secretion protein|nr:efflux RND transporter periplasmic adaptor subunit [Bacteroidales bacterium]
MKFILKFGIALSCFVCLFSCSQRHISADAYGSFEADDIIVSTYSDGIVLDFAVNEGQTLTAGQYIATIDTMSLVVQKKKLELQLESFLTQQTSLPNRFKLLNDSLLKVNRFISDVGLISMENNARQIAFDSLHIQRKNLEKAIDSQKKSFSMQVKLLAAQAEQFYLQLQQLNDALAKCIIKSPVDGVAITKYINRFELAGTGFPVIRIADLSQVDLKVYITEDQLSSVQLGAACTVYIDDMENDLKEYQGNITWISSESEFTPKMIQTKKERVNMVYAVKIKVKNDGSIKIGMPGEVVFHNFK